MINELSDKPTYYIEGVENFGESVIKVLEDLGGKNTEDYHGDNPDYYYFISENSEICICHKNYAALRDLLFNFGSRVWLPRYLIRNKNNYVNA